MDVEELLTFQPELPSTGTKRKGDQSNGTTGSKRRAMAAGDPENILELIEGEEPAQMDDAALKKLILLFEKRAYKNQEMRIKFPDMPEKFMESEIELNETVHEMHVLATVPELYRVVVDLNAVQSLLQLIHHENTDISIAVVDLLQEMTDVDTDNEDGTNLLIDALMAGQFVALLVSNMERLDESNKEEADGVHNTLGIFENMFELRPELVVEASQQGLMAWILSRLRAKMPFDVNKLYASEILAILLQDQEEPRTQLGDMDGIDVLLQQLATYKRHDPATPEEIEFMENLFNCLCSALAAPATNRQRFLRGEGLQLMNLMLREKKMSRPSAIKVLNHAMSGSGPQAADNCHKFVDILGLRSLFPLFMKTPKADKRAGPSRDELEEHIISITASMLKNCTGTQRQRLLNKFVENDHEKVERLMEMHFKYLAKIQAVDERIEREKYALRQREDAVEDEVEEQFYLRRLEAGLFTLQLIDYTLLEVCHSGAPSIKQRVMQIMNYRGASVKAIKAIMREYAGNIGDAQDEETREAEQDKILQLVERFSN